MPTYDYECENCGHIEEVSHSMKESPEIKCQKCDSNMGKVVGKARIEGWIRGNGLVNDVGGARRDMNLYKLQKEDPYSQHRVPGEKSYLEDKFRRGGKHPSDLRSKNNPKWVMRDGKLVPINKAAIEMDQEK